MATHVDYATMPMRDVTSLPVALTPVFICDVDEPIPLYQGDGVLSIGGEDIRAHTEIRFAWAPHLGVSIRFHGLVRPEHGEATLRVPRIGLTAAVLPLRTRWGSEVDFEGLLNGAVELGNPAAMARMIFHVPNFHSVIGRPIRRGQGSYAARFTLVSPPWSVTIDPVPCPASSGQTTLTSRLEQKRGSAITHVGDLERIDGADFSAAEAAEVLDDVGRTLSLARAGFSVPLLRIGFDRSGARVWETWTPFRTTAWRTHQNWFSTRDPGVLQSVFNGWRQAPQATAEMLGAALNLYIDAHAPGLAVESRLVLMQAALEGMAEGWPHAPLPGSTTLAGDGAAARISQITASLAMPPLPQLTHLDALTLPPPRATLLDKMVWVRNSVAHLGNLPRLSAHPSLLRLEASQLAALTLELALLRMLDADGRYVNRVSADARWDTERLPWLP